MKIKVLTSVAALATGLAFASPAFAQVMVKGIEVPEAEVQAVTDYCASLEASGGVAPTDVDTSAVTSIDLTTVTLEDCVAAGLVTDAGAGMSTDAGATTNTQ